MWTRNANKDNNTLIANKALADVTKLANFLITQLNFPAPDHTIALTKFVFEPPHDETKKMACAPSEYSDQPGHPPSLIRVFAVRSMGS